METRRQKSQPGNPDASLALREVKVRVTPKAQTRKAKVEKQDYIQLKNFSAAKTSTN